MIAAETSPLWVRLIVVAVGASIGVPVVMSLVFRHEYQFWQLVALLTGCAWLFVCGFVTTIKPLVIARYFARPGTYDLMLRDRHPTFTRVYFAVAGSFMMLIAIFLGSMFFVLRGAPTPRGHAQAAHP